MITSIILWIHWKAKDMIFEELKGRINWLINLHTSRKMIIITTGTEEDRIILSTARKTFYAKSGGNSFS